MIFSNIRILYITWCVGRATVVYHFKWSYSTKFHVHHPKRQFLQSPYVPSYQGVGGATVLDNHKNHQFHQAPCTSSQKAIFSNLHTCLPTNALGGATVFLHRPFVIFQFFNNRHIFQSAILVRTILSNLRIIAPVRGWCNDCRVLHKESIVSPSSLYVSNL